MILSELDPEGKEERLKEEESGSKRGGNEYLVDHGRFGLCFGYLLLCNTLKAHGFNQQQFIFSHDPVS